MVFRAKANALDLLSKFFLCFIIIGLRDFCFCICILKHRQLKYYILLCNEILFCVFYSPPTFGFRPRFGGSSFPYHLHLFSFLNLDFSSVKKIILFRLLWNIPFILKMIATYRNEALNDLINFGRC